MIYLICLTTLWVLLPVEVHGQGEAQVALQHRGANRPAEAGAAWLAALKSQPEADLSGWCEGDLAKELQSAGALREFVALRVAWIKGINSQPAPIRHAAVFREMRPFVEQLLKLPEGIEPARDLLVAFAGVMRGRVRMDTPQWSEAVPALEPLYVAAGAEKELAAWVLREFVPWAKPPAGLKNGALLYPLAPNEFWWRPSGQPGQAPRKIAGVALLELLKRHGLLVELVSILEQNVRKDRTIPLTLLAARCVHAPERAGEWLLQYMLSGGTMPPEITDLPGISRELIVRTLLGQIAAKERGVSAAKATMVQGLLEMALRYEETAGNRALLLEILNLAVRVVDESAVLPAARRLPAEQWEAAHLFILHLLAQGMKVEAEQIFDTAIGDYHASIAPLADMVDVSVSARAAGCQTLADKASSNMRASLRTLSPPEQWTEPVALQALEIAELAIANGLTEESAELIRSLRRVPFRVNTPPARQLRILEQRLSIATEPPKLREFVTWTASDSAGRRLLCWHAGVVADPLQVKAAGGDLAQRFVWPEKQDARLADHTIMLQQGVDGAKWKEAAVPAAMTVSGHLPLPEGAYARTEIRRGAATVVEGKALRRGEVCYTSATAPPSLLLPGGRIVNPVAQKLEPAPPWTALPPSMQPGSSGWTIEVPLTSAEGFSLVTPAIRVDPMQPLQMSGWARVEGAPGVKAAIKLEAQSRDNFTFMHIFEQIPVGSGAWVFLPPGKSASAGGPRVRLSISVSGTRGQTDTSTVRISCSDLLVQSFPAEGFPPFPQKIIGAPGGWGQSLDVSPDGTWLAAGLTVGLMDAEKEGHVFRVNADGAGEPLLLAAVPVGVRNVAISADGRHIFALNLKGSLFRLNAAQPDEPELLATVGPSMGHISVSPAGDMLAVSGERQAHFFRLEGNNAVPGPLVDGPPGFAGSPERISWSADGKRALLEGPLPQGAEKAKAAEARWAVFGTADGNRFPPLVVDGSEAPDITVKPPRTLRPPRLFASRSAAGMTVTVALKDRELSLTRTGEKLDGKWKLPDCQPHASVLDLTATLLYTIGESGIIRCWELPRQ